MTTTETHVEEHEAEGPEAHGHPSEREYVAVAMVLAAITAAEVAVYYVKSMPHPLMIGVLCGLAAVKFSLVVLWFMHLRFDNPIFRRLFVTGIVVAISVYLIALSSLHVLSD